MHYYINKGQGQSISSRSSQNNIRNTCRPLYWNLVVIFRDGRLIDMDLINLTCLMPILII